MSGLPGPLARRKKRFVNLLSRGRQLHYGNANTLLIKNAGVRLPPKMSGATDLVYTAGQVVIAFLFIEAKGYLDDSWYDPFTDAVFADVAGPAPDRLRALVEGYAALAPSPMTLNQVLVRDLTASMLGEAHPAALEALSGTLASMQKLTRLYCAMVFDDAATVRALQ